MKRVLTIVCCWALCVALPAFGEEGFSPDTEAFLANRQLVGVVTFSPGSASLGAAAKNEIARIVSRLRKLDAQKVIVRVEGFASPDGADSVNVPISMLRAKAVVDYMRSRKEVTPDLYITGFGASEGGQISADRRCRVEVALYENIWESGQVTSEKIVVR